MGKRSEGVQSNFLPPSTILPPPSKREEEAAYQNIFRQAEDDNQANMRNKSFSYTPCKKFAAAAGISVATFYKGIDKFLERHIIITPPQPPKKQLVRCGGLDCWGAILIYQSRREEEFAEETLQNKIV